MTIAPCILARFPGITWPALIAEAQREADLRRTTYPRLVAKGRMRQADADFQTAVMAAIAGEVAASMSVGTHAPDPRFSWADRLRVLRREVDMRLKVYPDWIRKGRIALGTARQQSAALECLLALYEEGWAWQPANGTSPAWGKPHPTAAQQASRTEWRDTWTQIEARRDAQNDNQQQRMAL